MKRDLFVSVSGSNCVTVFQSLPPRRLQTVGAALGSLNPGSWGLSNSPAVFVFIDSRQISELHPWSAKPFTRAGRFSTVAGTLNRGHLQVMEKQR